MPYLPLRIYPNIASEQVVESASVICRTECVICDHHYTIDIIGVNDLAVLDPADEILNEIYGM